MDHLTIIQPDDWHVHLRDGASLQRTVADSAHQFARAIVMPNLKPPVTHTSSALQYRERILEHVPAGHSFEPLMTLYLTNATTEEEIHQAADSGVVKALKLYPAGATTNSDAGVTDIRACYPVFRAMAERGLLLLVHGEVTDSDVDIFDREAVFLSRHLAPILNDVPELKVVLEHITTQDSVDFVARAGANIAATITAHHLLFDRNDMLAGGIRPHYYCLPILKRRRHQEALLEAATSGHSRYFLGTDSAPHPVHAKESSCGCAGSYTAFHAMELYATAFESVGALDRLEGFSSLYGPDFYGLPANEGRLRLSRAERAIPETLLFGSDAVRPILAGEAVGWTAALV